LDVTLVSAGKTGSVLRIQYVNSIEVMESTSARYKSTCMGQIRNAYLLVGKPEGKKPLGKT
jgi:hypothetical protein